ncbi:group II truncated hemoglobin [Microbispora sp. KK1-11]|uniref:group II truncated hemoglobin n=1 Tax=Microbispora sp. KK1-11 TaxID=2053005 RepID=UPI001157EF11|nr:group II truncated hemoglobin [Microbispora sp. KK1-11]TQS26488.1 globin [Microbispora sp. KK1-11]
MTTMYEHVGGEAALRKFAEHFHESVLRDPLLKRLFEYGSSHHAENLTAFFVEMMGGPSRFSDELGGFEAIFRAHQGLRITDEQRDRFVELMLRAADEAGLPGDARFRQAFTRQVTRAAGFSTKVSHDAPDAYQAPYPPMGRWDW